MHDGEKQGIAPSAPGVETHDQQRHYNDHRADDVHGLPYDPLRIVSFPPHSYLTLVFLLLPVGSAQGQSLIDTVPLLHVCQSGRDDPSPP